MIATPCRYSPACPITRDAASIDDARAAASCCLRVVIDQQHSADARDASTDSAALDRLRRFGGGKLLREMIGLFLAAAPERLIAARGAIAAANVAGAELALHSLKSSSAQLGAVRMHHLCEEGERRARDGSLVGVPALIDELEQEFTRVREWLTNARDEGTP